MLEKLDRCPLCSSEDNILYMTTKDYSITGESFSITKCENCHFLFTNPRPDEKSIGKYYQSDEYISHSDKSNSIIAFMYKLVRNHTLGQKLRLINSLSVRGKILDYGCGTGYFLKICKEDGWHAYGIEPNDIARELATKNTSAQIDTALDNVTQTDFQIITLWHVLEHVHHLHDVFSKLVSMLNAKGRLIIAVPNHKAADAVKYQNHWAAYDVPRHLYHFDQETMLKLAGMYNLKIIQTLPMKFDSYYVSMLSEKYKGNRLNLIKPFLQGFKSNLKATKNKEYSSLIYILSK